MPCDRILRPILLLMIAVGLAASPSMRAQQKMDSLTLDRAREMLRDAYDSVKKHYYDPKFHGLDWDARYHESEGKMREAASLSQAFAVIAGFLDGLNDSHTYFRPPSRQIRVDTGFRMQLYGDLAFITRVRPGTDAEAKVHPGDQIIRYGSYSVDRRDFDRLSYFFGALAPQKITPLQVLNPAGQSRQVEVESKVRERKRVMDLTGSSSDFDLWQLIREEENEDHVVRQRWSESGEVMFWKMPEFFLNESEVDHLFSIARKHSTLILDLRGNPGGSVVTLERMVGNVFDHDVKIADRVGRKESKPQLAKSRGGNAFTGKMIVLVDSESGSAAELFARVVQLEHRATVIGDRSSGSVMEAKGYSYSQGADTKIFYSFSVTDADLIMADGKSLEHTGVTPDEVVLPTAEDLALGRDPCLTRAAELAGIKLDPATAGRMFPFEWVPF